MALPGDSDAVEISVRKLFLSSAVQLEVISEACYHPCKAPPNVLDEGDRRQRAPRRRSAEARAWQGAHPSVPTE